MHGLGPADINGLRPARSCFCEEVGLLKAALKSWTLSGHLVSGFRPRSGRVPMWDQLRDDQHLRFDGQPHIKPNSPEDVLIQHTLNKPGLKKPESHLKYSEFDLVHSIVKNSVKDLRRRLGRGNKVLLLGRDVWLWEVLCKKYGVRTLFDPQISRAVAKEIQQTSKLKEYDIQDGDILFDTGFAGSIYLALRRAIPDKDLKCVLLSVNPHANASIKQQFPNYGLARNRALVIEYTPKYFESGYVRGGKVEQNFSNFREFIDSALLTAWAWHAESPSWIPGPSSRRRKMNLA